jgi:hypothetical protein
MRASNALTAVALSLCAASVARAQHGEDHQHGAGEEAPWGVVEFATSASPAAHGEFLAGVLYLHNFHYPQAVEAFRRAQALDPGDVMSYWGEALSYTHPVWNEQDAAAARAALRRLGPTREARLARARTERERQWLESAEAMYAEEGTKAARDTAYSAVLGRLHAADPADPEAGAFYALSLLGLNQGDREAVAYARAAALADSLFTQHPRHPGAAHYLIHAVDDPHVAAHGLSAARAYSGIAPDAVHAQHMTSHIFLAMGMWDDVIAANLRARPSRNGHSAAWLAYGLEQVGRYREAAAWIDSMVTASRQGPAPRLRGTRAELMGAAAIFAAEPGRSAWPTARVDVERADLGFSASAGDFGLGYAAAQRGDRALADSMLRSITARNAQPTGSTPLQMPSDRGYAQVMEKTLRAALVASAGDREGALALLKDAAALEAALPLAFGPPATIKPPHEAAGELLLVLDRPVEARAEFEAALLRTPRRATALLGLARAQRASGQTAAARETYRTLAAMWSHADADVPGLAEVRERCGCTL